MLERKKNWIQVDNVSNTPFDVKLSAFQNVI